MCSHAIFYISCIEKEPGITPRLLVCVYIYIKTSGSESRPRKVELASAHKKHDYREYFTYNNEAYKIPTKQPYRIDIFIS